MSRLTNSLIVRKLRVKLEVYWGPVDEWMIAAGLYSIVRVLTAVFTATSPDKDELKTGHTTTSHLHHVRQLSH